MLVLYIEKIFSFKNFVKNRANTLVRKSVDYFGFSETKSARRERLFLETKSDKLIKVLLFVDVRRIVLMCRNQSSERNIIDRHYSAPSVSFVDRESDEVFENGQKNEGK